MSKLLDETYKLSEEIQRLAPWNTYVDSDVMYLGFNGEEDADVYVSVMGNANEVYGIAFYEGEEGLGIYLDMLMNDDPSPSHADYMAISMKCLTVYYDPISVIKQGPFTDMIDKRYKDAKGAIPYLVKFDFPYVYSGVEGDDLRRLNRYLKAFLLVLKQVDENGYSYDETCEIITAEIDDSDPDDIDCTLITMPRPYMSLRYQDVKYDTRHLKQVLKKAKKTDELLIIDEDVIGPFEDDSVDRPFFAQMLYFIDEQGQIVSIDMLKPTDDKFQIVIDKLANLIERKGIPDVVCVRKPELVYLMEHLSDECGIDLGQIEWQVFDEEIIQIREHLDQFLG